MILSELLEYAIKYNTGIAVENLPIFPDNSKLMPFYSSSFEDLATLVDSFDDERMGICWNFGHANLLRWEQTAAIEFLESRIKCTQINIKEVLMPHSISLSDFNGDALTQLRAAASYLQDNPGTTLHIPAGEYLLEDADAVALQNDVMRGAHGENPHRYLFNRKSAFPIAMHLTGAKSCTIESDGAVFYANGFMQYLVMEHCKGIRVKGISFDMKRRPYSYGRVTDVADDHYDVRFFDEDVTENMPAARMLFMDESNTYFEYQYIQGIDAQSGKKRLADGAIRFPHTISPHLKGRDFYCAHTFHSRPSIAVYRCEDVVMDRIAIHSAPGMGINTLLTKNFSLVNSTVSPAIGRKMSTNTDILHFVSAFGNYEIRNCYFEGSGDDVMNVHCYTHKVLRVQGNVCVTKLPTSNNETHCILPDVPLADNQFKLCGTELEFTVKNASFDHESGEYTIEFHEPLPTDIIGQKLWNLSVQPTLTFTDCHTCNNNARAILLRTGNAHVRNCTFEHSMLGALQLRIESATWNEIGSGENYTIEHCRMNHCGHATRDLSEHATIGICGEEEPIRNVLIQNNTFENTDAVLYQHNAECVTLSDNRHSSCIVGGEK